MKTKKAREKNKESISDEKIREIEKASSFKLQVELCNKWWKNFQYDFVIKTDTKSMMRIPLQKNSFTLRFMTIEKWITIVR